ncbi:hypothetical protein UFOVP1367_27 [uncultured Caudovirales phage]|uniref:Uncharacterized protein n=1 Tax=uncultured Caudovirales phage TaxID=2100421 RepID=A0A6J5S3L8_9CAUD|nr:hypothetical protein KNT69_gp27 [uncultured Caudovirales phage]CAB4202619.1 hypothetical protein UFOVP1367_27 [uncultured Caudovirales phage]
MKNQSKLKPHESGELLLAKVRAGFICQRKTLNSFCIENGIDQSNATKCIKGTLKGKKSIATKKLIIQASQTKRDKSISA